LPNFEELVDFFILEGLIPYPVDFFEVVYNGMPEIRSVDSLLFVSKLALCHCKSKVELPCYLLSYYWQKFAENVLAVYVPRKIIGIKVALFVIEVGVPLHFVGEVLREHLGYRVFFLYGGTRRLGMQRLLLIYFFFFIIYLLKKLRFLGFCIVHFFLFSRRRIFFSCRYAFFCL
jgi:hypothetical protein